MQRFSFLLEVCVPGTVPDAQLIGAILDLVCAILLDNNEQNSKTFKLIS